ncbi:SapC family protein [Roseinatronobacter sp. S2]|uniref:SapC family protein n=1 Tax=Roseinatronobacter sp. S2 TaxID=3035471 RepID=UPI00240EA594|nr:SapC family protein [Roseinatronobacter sp. S2]WFE73682.1 SapC family protein [Roseinatronobacter sp. S2]
MNMSCPQIAAGTWVPLSHTRHGTWRWCRAESFGFAQAYRHVPVTLDEGEGAAANMPVVFMPDGMPVAVLRLARRGKSAFVASRGVWRGSYVPDLLRAYPFAPNGWGGDGDAPMLVDEASDLVARDGLAHGLRIFDDNGALVPPLGRLRDMLRAHAQAEHRTRGAAQDLVQAGVLVPFAQGTPLAGFHGIDRAALAGLGRVTVAQLHRSGALFLAQAHFVSLCHVPVLQQAEAAFTAPPSNRSLHGFMAALSDDLARPNSGV